MSLRAKREQISSWAAMLIDAVSINQTKQIERDGQIYLHKRRRLGRSTIIAIGNLFLKFSHSRIVMFVGVKRWQLWEVYSFSLLHGGPYACEISGNDGILMAQLPGQSLKTLLRSEQLSDVAIIAAGQEFRRAHALRGMTGGWTHGDPHLDNVLYDGNRARLIDFETQHEPGLSDNERCADDLLVFLLDLAGKVDTTYVMVWSKLFLMAYDNPAIIRGLYPRLQLPHGLERILWKARTAYLPISELEHRLDSLRNMIDNEKLCEP